MPKIEMTRMVIRHFPDRKKPCLCIEQGNQAMVLATFRNKECEELYKQFLGGNCMQREMSLIFEEVNTDDTNRCEN